VFIRTKAIIAETVVLSRGRSLGWYVFEEVAGE